MSRRWFVVWDPWNESEEFATGLDAEDAEDAAEKYLEQYLPEPEYPDEVVVRCADDSLVVVAVEVDYDPVFTTYKRPFYGPQRELS